MNKKQAESFFNVQELNHIMKNHKIAIKYHVIKDFNGDYVLATSDESSNLPEKLALLQRAKKAKYEYFLEKMRRAQNE